MARTSKTKIGDSGESNDRMMRAAESGSNAKARGHNELMNQYRANADQTNQTAQVANQVVGQGLERNQQQEQFESRQAQESSQFNRQMDQRKSETDLEAAKAGFERGGDQGGEQGQEPGGDAARKQQLEEEMRKGEGQPKIGPLDAESQQRLNKQAEQPLEMDSNGRWRPTQERKDAQARSQKREDFQADTERIRAMAYRDQVGMSAQKALAAGDMDAYNENVDRLVATPNGMQKRYDRLMKGDVNSNDWGELAEMAKGSEEVEPTLMADLKAKNFTPRVAAFMRAQVQKDALQSIVLSKGSTNKLEVDWTAPKMREFQSEVASMNDFMRANPALGQLGFIKSTDDKMRFLNVMAAAKVLTGQSRAPSPSGGMTPATAPQAQQQGGQKFNEQQSGVGQILRGGQPPETPPAAPQQQQQAPRQPHQPNPLQFGGR